MLRSNEFLLIIGMYFIIKSLPSVAYNVVDCSLASEAFIRLLISA